MADSSGVTQGMLVTASELPVGTAVIEVDSGGTPHVITLTKEATGTNATASVDFARAEGASNALMATKTYYVTAWFKNSSAESQGKAFAL